MKTFSRIGFAALIVLSVAIQSIAARRAETAESDPIARLAAELERLHVRTDRSAAEANMLTGLSPLCGQPIRAALSRIDGSDDEWLRGVHSADDRVKYVYLGSVDDTRDQTSLIGRSLWARARFVIGLSSVNPPSNLILVALPRACPALETLDWAALSPAD